MSALSFINGIKGFVKLLNRRRIKSHKVRLGKKYDAQNFVKIQRPEKIKKVLLVDCQLGFGDFLYFAGLARKLSCHGVCVSVGTIGSALDRYKNQPYLCAVYDIERDAGSINGENYDLIFDLTYVNINYWPERSSILKRLSRYAITCGDVSSQYHLYQEYCDISSYTHTAKRMGKIYAAIVGEDEEAIPPFFYVSDEEVQREAAETLKKIHQEDFVVYLNSKARDKDRCLSDDQTCSIVNKLKGLHKIKIILFSKVEFNDSDVINMPNVDFSTAAKIIHRANAIVSPDTSIVHLGSAFNIPTFAIFCGNDRDYFPQYPMKEVWGPLAENSFIFSCDKPHTFDYAVPLDKVTPISDINPEMLSEVVKEFVQGLIKKESHKDSLCNINGCS